MLDIMEAHLYKANHSMICRHQITIFGTQTAVETNSYKAQCTINSINKLSIRGARTIFDNWLFYWLSFKQFKGKVINMLYATASQRESRYTH